MRSFVRYLAIWKVSLISFARCFLDSQHQFRVLFFSNERFIGPFGSTSFHDISVDPKQIRNLGKRCLSFDLRSRLITQTIILAIRNLVFHFYFADGKNTGYIFRQNIRGTIYTEMKESATSFFVSKKSHFYNNLRRNLIKFS